MEYVGEENLQDLLEQIGKIYLTEQKVLNWFIQICLAVQHYHKRKMLCRDLQLHNIFFDSRDTIKIGNFNPIRKIDMNFSKRFRFDNLDLIQPVPPECIEFEQVSEQTESWYLGLILYEMCTLQPPYQAASLYEAAELIKKG